MTVFMTVDKRCAASRRALQAESAASKTQHVKNTFAKNFEKSKQMHAQKTACGNEFAKVSSYFSILVFDILKNISFSLSLNRKNYA